MSDLQPTQCPGCGAPIVIGREDCEYCGTKYPKKEPEIVKIIEKPVVVPQYIEQPVRVSKDKTVAVLLAIFFGFWAWIYTWDRDKGKFWFGLIGTIVTLGWGYFAFWIWAVIAAVVRKQEFYNNYPH